MITSIDVIANFFFFSKEYCGSDPRLNGKGPDNIYGNSGPGNLQ